MAKTRIQRTEPVSAHDIAPIPEAAIGGFMTIDSTPMPKRDQLVDAAFAGAFETTLGIRADNERVPYRVLPSEELIPAVIATASVEALQDVPTANAVMTPIHDSGIPKATRPTVELPVARRQEPRPEEKKKATAMIATPIDSALRKEVRDLRNFFQISESFVIESALRLLFDGRTLDDVAGELKAQGGRLRRSR